MTQKHPSEEEALRSSKGSDDQQGSTARPQEGQRSDRFVLTDPPPAVAFAKRFDQWFARQRPELRERVSLHSVRLERQFPEYQLSSVEWMRLSAQVLWVSERQAAALQRKSRFAKRAARRERVRQLSEEICQRHSGALQALAEQEKPTAGQRLLRAAEEAKALSVAARLRREHPEAFARWEEAARLHDEKD